MTWGRPSAGLVPFAHVTSGSFQLLASPYHLLTSDSIGFVCHPNPAANTLSSEAPPVPLRSRSSSTTKLNAPHGRTDSRLCQRRWRPAVVVGVLLRGTGNQPRARAIWLRRRRQEPIPEWLNPMEAEADEISTTSETSAPPRRHAPEDNFGPPHQATRSLVRTRASGGG